MATMNFSIPDDVKDRFNDVFADANKSAIVTRLLQTAIAQVERKQRSDAAVKRVLKRRAKGPKLSTKEILSTLHDLRTESDLAHG